MRSWVIDSQLAPEQDDVVADVFQFADSAQARLFFSQATSTRCHSDGTERPASRPAHARNLIWVNPDGFAQEDVFLLRGARVYRVSDVRPQSLPARPSSSGAQAGVATVNSIACALADASCQRPSVKS